MKAPTHLAVAPTPETTPTTNAPTALPPNPFHRREADVDGMVVEAVADVRFVLLDDTPGRVGVHDLVLDETRLVKDEHGAMVHPPKIFGRGVSAHTRQLREAHVSMVRGDKISLPWSQLPALLNIFCTECAAMRGELAAGRCREQAHRREGRWEVRSGARVGPTQIKIYDSNGEPFPMRFTEELRAQLAAENRIAEGADPGAAR